MGTHWGTSRFAPNPPACTKLKDPHAIAEPAGLCGRTGSAGYPRSKCRRSRLRLPEAHPGHRNRGIHVTQSLPVAGHSESGKLARMRKQLAKHRTKMAVHVTLQQERS